MRIERVVTNETCNQNCWFCNARRPAERPDFIARRAVRERIAAARAGDPREIILTGGEPAMRSDLVDPAQRAAEGPRAVTAGGESARRVGVVLRLGPASYIPPCLFEVPERVTHPFALNPGPSGRGGFRRVPECEACLVNDRCPGLPDGAAARE